LSKLWALAHFLTFIYEDLGPALKLEYQDKGYGTESATAFMNSLVHAFELKHICAMVTPSNIRGNNLISKLRFERDGDGVIEPRGVHNVYMLPGMPHLSKGTTVVSRWGVEK